MTIDFPSAKDLRSKVNIAAINRLRRKLQDLPNEFDDYARKGKSYYRIMESNCWDHEEFMTLRRILKRTLEKGYKISRVQEDYWNRKYFTISW